MDKGIVQLIERLRRRLGPSAARAAPPAESGPVVRQVRPDDDLPARFAAAAADLGVVVLPCPGWQWPRAACDALVQERVRSAAVFERSFPAALAEKLPSLLDRLRAAGIDAVADPDQDALFAVDASITGVDAAVAETGSIVCASGVGVPRGASLYPLIHLAVVGRDQLAPDLLDWLTVLSAPASSPSPPHGPPSEVAAHAALPSCISLVTGPSKTADIEGVLVTGVHGPGRVIVVLVE